MIVASTYAATTVTLQEGKDGYSGCLDVEIRDPNQNPTKKGPYPDRWWIIEYCPYCPRARVLIKFDLTSIHQNATVTSAVLHIFTDSQQGPQDHTVSVYRVAREWDAAATWTKATATTNWSNAGGDRGEVVCEKRIPGNQLNVWESYDITSAIAEFVADPSKNTGVLLKVTQGTDGHGYYGSEWYLVDYRPKLVVTYDAGAVHRYGERLQ